MSMSDPFEDDPALSALVNETSGTKKTSLSELIAEPAEAVQTVKDVPPTPTAALTAEQKKIRELENQLAIANANKFDSAQDEFVVATSDNKLLIHVLEDGLTFNGQVWYRGQEIEFDLPGGGGDTQPFEDTKDRHGKTWLALDEAAQMRRWGKVRFRRGPWPGVRHVDPAAEEAERQRRRAAPKMPSAFAN